MNVFKYYEQIKNILVFTIYFRNMLIIAIIKIKTIAISITVNK